MADYPLPQLGGQTPLQYASTPHMDALARRGRLGLARTVPPGFPPGSDVANLSVLGYDPRLYYTGRSPLEAVSMGVELRQRDVAFRCNLVTLSEEGDYAARTMLDYSADEISTEEAAALMAAVQERLGQPPLSFHAGVSYRHLMVWREGPDDFHLTPPHDISDRVVGPHLPAGAGAARLLELMVESSRFLPEHPVNRARVARGLKPANSIWLWGQGCRPALRSFREKYGLAGSVVAAVDLTRGLGRCAGLNVVDVPGATGNIHTNFRGKAEAALAELRAGRDFVYVHVEAADEAGHRGELETKLRAIEEIDRQVLGTILAGLEELGDYRLLLLPDHPTPLVLKTHVADPVPFLTYQRSDPREGSPAFHEEAARATGWVVEEGHRLMDIFLGR